MTETTGGDTFGNWASGNEKILTAPPSTMTMDSTDAKIGREMKKRENTAYFLEGTPQKAQRQNTKGTEEITRKTGRGAAALPVVFLTFFLFAFFCAFCVLLLCLLWCAFFTLVLADNLLHGDNFRLHLDVGPDALQSADD